VVMSVTWLWHAITLLPLKSTNCSCRAHLCRIISDTVSIAASPVALSASTHSNNKFSWVLYSCPKVLIIIRIFCINACPC
jgi:hypothetical protein